MNAIKLKVLGRRATAILAVGAAALVLTGCAQELAIEEIQESPERIIQTGKDFWEGERWSYVNAEGVERALSVDCSEAFSGRCWTDPDGTVEFRYSKGKSGIGSERLIIDGAELEADCSTLDIWSGEYACAPIPVEES